MTIESDSNCLLELSWLESHCRNLITSHPAPINSAHGLVCLAFTADRLLRRHRVANRGSIFQLAAINNRPLSEKDVLGTSKTRHCRC
jgi:hypothetical protein